MAMPWSAACSPGVRAGAASAREPVGIAPPLEDAVEPGSGAASEPAARVSPARFSCRACGEDGRFDSGTKKGAASFLEPASLASGTTPAYWPSLRTRASSGLVSCSSTSPCEEDSSVSPVGPNLGSAPACLRSQGQSTLCARSASAHVGAPLWCLRVPESTTLLWCLAAR